jgi:hypothetical protein
VRTRLFAVSLVAVMSACGTAAPPRADEVAATLVESARALTGRAARIVWVQHDGADVHAQTGRLAIGGLDTEDGKSERLIVAEFGNYAKPLLTGAGDRVVFSSRRGNDMHVVNWDGTGRRRLGEGFALAIWTDPATRTEWLYAGRDRQDDAYAKVVRFPIDQPERVEPVWSTSLVGEDSFDLAADGRSALAMFPWPRIGVADLPDGAWRQIGEGCWTGLARGPRPIAWWLDDEHKGLSVVDIGSPAKWRVALDTAPGFANAEVYHPRATADPQLLVLTGPFNRGGWNQARAGGAQVEVYLARFDAEFKRIASWARVTSNGRGEGYPDVWLGR